MTAERAAISRTAGNPALAASKEAWFRPDWRNAESIQQEG
jgi:hypothetical protein